MNVEVLVIPLASAIISALGPRETLARPGLTGARLLFVYPCASELARGAKSVCCNALGPLATIPVGANP
jgi:hypothetical protein